MPRSRLTVPLLLGAAYAFLVIPLGIVLWSRAVESLPSERLRVLRLVHEQIRSEFVEERPADELMTGAIKGMVESLGDPFSRFIEAERVQHFQETELEGTYQGIGVLMVPNRTPLTVLAPLAGGPAEAAGVRVGDRIVAIDGETVADVSAEEVLRVAAERLRGPADSSVTIGIERGGHGDRALEQLELRVERAHVATPKVRWAHLIDADRRLGYVYVEGFQRGVTEELDRALEQLAEDAGGALDGLVLDLRFDRGGLLTEAVQLVNRFVPTGRIVSLRRRGDIPEEVHEADPERCTHPDLPLVLLVNNRSASAAEVVTGALQDHDRATVVGENTYGKGMVQSIFSWGEARFRLKLTTSRYYTPDGRPIPPPPPGVDPNARRPADAQRNWGLEPDVRVPLRAEQNRFVNARLASHEVARPYRAAARALAARLGMANHGPLTPEEDRQLAAALRALRRALGEEVAEPQPVGDGGDAAGGGAPAENRDR